MPQIKISDMSYYYEDFFHPVFEHVDLNLDSDWKLGLIGRNGRGKSTLLHLIEGTIHPSEGSVDHALDISYFPYSIQTKYTKTMDIIKEIIAGLKTIEDQMEHLLNSKDERDQEKYIENLSRYYELDGFQMESIIRKEWNKMGLDEALLEHEFDTLSGGEKTSILILALFIKKDGFVLLDEPTNHLDTEKKKNLCEYLKRKQGFILVSHDMKFLNEVVDHILAINKATISLEQGNYDSWRRNMILVEQHELRVRTRLEREVHQLECSSKQRREWSNVGNTQKYEFASNARANGNQAYMRQVKRAEQKIQEDLEEKRNLLKNVEEEIRLGILQENMESCLLEISALTFGYPYEKKLLRDFNLKVYSGERIWVRGMNGAGKSTLFRLILQEILCDNMTYADDIIIEHTTQEPRWQSGNIRELLEESKIKIGKFYELCSVFNLPEDFDHRPVETLSSGELKKLDIARALSVNHHLLLMDEPLNYMDLNFRDQLASAVLESDATILFIEHDEAFGACIATRAVWLHE